MIRDSYGTSDSFSTDGSGDVSDSFLMSGSFSDEVTKQKDRGFLGWRSSADYIMGDSTDFDNMGRGI